MYGACVCIPQEEARVNNLVAVINEMQVNLATLTPSFISFLNPEDVPSLKTLALVGESMSEAHIETWSKISLINAYGPTETAVTAAIRPGITPGTDCRDIGFPIGALAWIVNPSDHDRLVPVGCTGELLLEGPTLARGYLNDPQKTSESFIFDPLWSQGKDEASTGRRFYKTGDLVRYNSDQGSLNYVGRKDTQVKLHGRRVELGEIEHHLNADPSSKHCLVLLPAKGHYKNRLVTVLSLVDSLEPGTCRDSTPFQLVEGPTKDACVEEMRGRISNHLPVNMLPSAWLCVEALPMLTSGKLDRKSVSQWVEALDRDVCQPAGLGNKPAQPLSDAERQLIAICGHVLNIPVQQIDCDRSFLGLGGDSITAMTFKGQAKSKGIELQVDQILRSKSFRALATCATEVGETIDHREAVNIPFELSPIQQLHFQVREQEQGHFNQSFFFRLSRKISEMNLRQAITCIIERHSMLRARFTRRGDTGEWCQRITEEVSTSYRLRSHNIRNKGQSEEMVADSQACLDASHGPVFAVDLFNLNENEQLLSLIGHHLVIDLVSWRVILDEAEQLLQGNPVLSLIEPSSPFQTWCRLQSQQCRTLSTDEILPGESVPHANFAFWGMTDKPNLYGDVACEGFEINSAVTSRIITDCHSTLRTETIDLLVAAMLHSFGQVFTDRSLPPIYNEGHGREPFGVPIDISRTVGWFTAICPIFVGSSMPQDLVEIVRRVKDFRRRVPANGRPYFASRFLSREGKDKYGHHHPMEVAFNFLGQYQQFERSDALLQPVQGLAGEAHAGGASADFASSTTRFGLFEISALIVKRQLRFSFTFNRHMRHQDRIRQWIARCQSSLHEIATRLAAMAPEPTLTDYPLLPLSHDGLATMFKEKLPKIGVTSFAEIEDVYPCSPMQQGLLLSRTQDAAFYTVHGTFELQDPRGKRPDATRLVEAWQEVVSRHAALRTIFVEGLSDPGSFDQVVLNHITTHVDQLQCDQYDEVVPLFDEHNLNNLASHRPPHRFSVCVISSGKVYCRLNMSHTIMDGMSMSIIFRDLALAYEGRLQNVSPRPLFSNFIARSREQHDQNGLEYWKAYLADPQPCHFPLLNDGISTTKRLCSLRLKCEDLSTLQAFCENNAITLANAFHMAWSLTLRSFNASEEVCFGYLTSVRDPSVPNAESIVGPCINMLTCRLKMPDSSTIHDNLRQLQRDYVNSLPYQKTPLADVQHALKLSNTSLFNTCLSFRRLERTCDSTADLVKFVGSAPIYDPTEYPISLNIEACQDDAAIDLDYWTDAISAGQAENVGSVFLKSLRNVFLHADVRIDKLDCLDDRMKHQLCLWNGQVPDAVEACVHTVIEKQAETRPEAAAIESWEEAFSYRQLNNLSGQLATYLMSLGVSTGTLVPTCFDKSAWTIIAMLAVLKAGGACVPLDATYPKPALETRVVDAEAQVVLASPQRAHMFEDIAAHVIPVGSTLLDQLSKFQVESASSTQPTDPCFVVYTSGSTGSPKGVVLEHRSIVTSAEAHGSILGIGSETRTLQFAAYTFDNSLEEIFTTLMRGGCVCVPSDHERSNDLEAAINRLGVNFIDLTPSVASLLKPSNLTAVKTLVVGGEALTKQVVELWGSSIPVHNMYGPSECSINATCNTNARVGDVSNIGRSIGSVSWVVKPSDHNQLVPIGCPGELLIEGPIVARGYLNDLDKTAQSFIENPEWATDYSRNVNYLNRRMYKTGDLVRYSSRGDILYLGRKDTQVKLRGQRIEVGEIEHHIKTKLPAGSQTAVELVSMPDTGRGSKALAAFLELSSKPSKTDHASDSQILPMSEDLMSSARVIESGLLDLLPAHMVPKLYIPVSGMPYTSSQKLDRRALRNMAQSLSYEEAMAYRLDGKSDRIPSTPTEKLLQQSFAAVLKLPPSSVGADDNFFRRGGDSLAAMQLVTAASNGGCPLTVSQIFQTPKLSDLARALSTPGQAVPKSIGPKLEPYGLLDGTTSLDALKTQIASLCRVSVDAIRDIYPCSNMQEGLIALSNKQPGAYVAQPTYKLPADIDLDRFRKAWNDVATEEAILRTRIVCVEVLGSVQVVVERPLSWESVATFEDAYRPLSTYEGGDLCRYSIVGEGTDVRHFVWTVHHALFDAWSLSALMTKVKNQYLNPARLAQVSPSPFSNFVQYLASNNSTQSNEFWRARLENSTSPQFPQLPHPAYEVQATSHLSHVAEVFKSPELEITMPSIVRSAWALVTAFYSNTDDVIFGEILTGRDAPVDGIEDIVGPTITIVPTRFQLDRNLSVEEYLSKSQKELAATIPHQFIGLRQIKNLIPQSRHACDFQTLLAVSHANDTDTDEFWDMTSNGAIDSSFYTYPLNISCTIHAENITINANYDSTILPTRQLSRLLGQFGNIIAKLASGRSDAEPIGEIEFLTSEDRKEIRCWNREPVQSVDNCIHQLIQRQAQKQPWATAVSSWDGDWTYEQLEQSATNLASWLMAMGIGRKVDALVPLCFEKSAFTIVAMLGVLKTGAAFVPIDPTHPVGRLRQIVSDTQAELILCSPRYQELCGSLAVKAVAVDKAMLQAHRACSKEIPTGTADSPAYVIFTSGTTGQPKGIVGKCDHFGVPLFCGLHQLTRTS